MASITMENSYKSTAKDMGESHVAAHSKQKKYKQADEPDIETLTGNNVSDSSLDLARQMAQKQGVLNEDDWEKYNRHLRKDRRKNSYEEYLYTLSRNLVHGKERKRDSKKATKAQREKISEELAAIDENHGIPIDGSLFYVSNTDKYDELNDDELKNYREFERKTLERFYHSDVFQKLNPGLFRAEIHFDENGAIHLQTQSVWYRKDGRGRLTYGKRAEVRELIEQVAKSKYGSSLSADKLADNMAKAHQLAEQDIKANDGNKIGVERADSRFFDYMKKNPDGYWYRYDYQTDKDGNYLKDSNGRRVPKLDKSGKPKSRGSFASAGERNTLVMDVWRSMLIDELGDIATQTAKEMGIDYHVDKTYTTDGIHRTALTYTKNKEDRQQAAKLHEQATQVVADAKKSATKIQSEAITALRESYEKVLDQKPIKQTKNGAVWLSPLEMATAIKKHTADLKKQADEAEQAKQEAEKARKKAEADKQAVDAELSKQREQLANVQQQTKDADDQLQKRLFARRQRVEQEIQEADGLDYSESITDDNVADAEKHVDKWRADAFKSGKEIYNYAKKNKRLMFYARGIENNANKANMTPHDYINGLNHLTNQLAIYRKAFKRIYRVAMAGISWFTGKATMIDMNLLNTDSGIDEVAGRYGEDFDNHNGLADLMEKYTRQMIDKFKKVFHFSPNPDENETTAANQQKQSKQSDSEDGIDL